MRQQSIRSLAEGAMMVGLISILLLADRYFAGLVELFFFWAIPIPLAVYTVKYGTRNGVVSAIALIFIAFMLATPAMQVLVIFSVLTGIIYGSFVYHDWAISGALIGTFLLTFLYQYLQTYLWATFFNYDLNAELTSLARLFINLPQVFKLYANLTLQQLIDFFRLLMPLIILFIAIAETYITHLVTSLLLNRLNIKQINLVSLQQMKLSKVQGIAIITTMLSSFWLYFNCPFVINCHVWLWVGLLSLGVFVTYGMVLIIVYAKYKDYLLLPFIAVFLLFLVPYIIIGLGLIDVFTNTRIKMVRRIMNERENSSP